MYADSSTTSQVECDDYDHLPDLHERAGQRISRGFDALRYESIGMDQKEP